MILFVSPNAAWRINTAIGVCTLEGGSPDAPDAWLGFDSIEAAIGHILEHRHVAAEKTRGLVDLVAQIGRQAITGLVIDGQRIDAEVVQESMESLCDFTAPIYIVMKGEGPEEIKAGFDEQRAHDE